MNTRRYWLYTPGEQACMWPDCVANGIMCIGWDDLGDLSQYPDREAIFQELLKITGRRAKNDSLANWQFANEIAPGDVVFVKKGRNMLLGMGVVISGYEFDSSRPDYKSIIRVNWTDTGEWQTDLIAPIKTLTDISGYTDYIEAYTQLVKHNVISEPEIRHWWLCSNSRTWNIGEWHVGQDRSYPIVTESGQPRPVYENFMAATPGDIVLCYDGVNTKALTGIARVSGKADTDAIRFEKTESLNHPIDISTIRGLGLLEDSEFEAHHMMSGFYSLDKDRFRIIYDLVRELNPQPVDKSNAAYSREDFLKEVYMTEDGLENLSSILRTKKNIILQGAPGVGKTYMARRLAYYMAGEKADDRIAMIQFHQNYSYEDFVMGYKPDGPDFVLRRGVFYRFCITAANDPERDYFFIIDEINRGNLSKIFGELLMLIERDYRGERLTLAYRDERFFVPPNIYIIGMMNTADRSLAMIDYALRRRFSFFPMKPGFDTEGFSAYRKTLNSPEFDRLITTVRELNEAIVNDKSLGEGFEIGHSYFCGQRKITGRWLQQVVDYDIIPTIAEYWFDNRREVDHWSSRLHEAIKPA